MTSPARQSEADRVEEVYRWALMTVGAAVARDALDLWDDAAPSVGDARYGTWLRAMRRLVLLRSGWLRSLSIAHFRLVRALRTGSTISVDGDSGTPSLEDLRNQFDQIVDGIERHAGTGRNPTSPAVSSPDEDEDLEVDEDNDDLDLDEFYNATIEEIEEQVETILTEVGPEKMNRDGEEDPAEARRKAGRRVSAEAERITLLASRGLDYNIFRADERVMGWVRYSTTGTPCGFCAMLLTRGFIPKSDGTPGWLYKSNTSASSKQEDSRYENGQAAGEQFHANCKCVAVPVFGESQLDSPIFTFNRELAEEYKRVTAPKNLNGEDAMTVWRRYVRKKYGDNPTAVPEAA